jgi:cytochrome c-type biogenesis protein CcmH/NrfF
MRRKTMTGALVLAFALATAAGCATGGTEAEEPEDVQQQRRAEDFDQYECPECIGAGESTIDEDEAP